jgi:hypothetical protein
MRGSSMKGYEDFLIMNLSTSRDDEKSIDFDEESL